jgi:hypothetical protein
MTDAFQQPLTRLILLTEQLGFQQGKTGIFDKASRVFKIMIRSFGDQARTRTDSQMNRRRQVLLYRLFATHKRVYGAFRIPV